MAAKKGCCCLRTLVSLLVALVILVGTVYCLYSFTSLSTYGVTKIGDFELGSLADVKLKDLWGALRGLSNADEDKIVTEKLDTEQGESAFRDLFGAGTSAGTSEAGQATVTVNGAQQAFGEDNVSLVVTQPVYFERQTVLTYGEDFLGVLFDKILSGDNELADALRGLGTANIAQLTIDYADGKAELTVVAKVNISEIVGEINDSLPSFLRLSEELYVTSTTEFAVSLTGETAGKLIAVEGGTSRILLNQLSEELSATLYQVIVERTGESALPARLEELNGMIFEQFSNVVANLGYAGTLDASGSRVPGGSVIEDGALKLLSNVREAD